MKKVLKHKVLKFFLSVFLYRFFRGYKEVKPLETHKVKTNDEEKPDPWHLRCADCGEVFNLKETRICPCWKESQSKLPFRLGEEVEVAPLGRVIGRITRLPPSTRFKFKVSVFTDDYYYYSNQLKKVKPILKEGA